MPIKRAFIFLPNQLDNVQKSGAGVKSDNYVFLFFFLFFTTKVIRLYWNENLSFAHERTFVDGKQVRRKFWILLIFQPITTELCNL